MPINKALAHFGLTLEQCFQVCGAEAGAVFMTDNKQYETIGTCGCPESGQSFAPAGNAVTCDQNSIYLYTHMPGATTPGSPGPSSYIKKREKERLEREANEVKAVCPVDLTPCNVIDGDGLSFECLDVNQELESCGGCINGGFGFQDGVVGVDCTALAGVDPSAVSCVQGQCKVSACKSGYKLVGGKCIGKDQIKIGSKGSINVDKKVRAEPKPVALAVPESRWVDPLELK
ncbi:hypothetical protein BD324DRAFT_457446 [Kockovaella imperatae]|uniref:Protein CPL1-like domain-containing protein n=1 Tax=Kockovaella imperatae TaxID=4999 RepID=A0A1Y1UGG3_9TREE|nr:hypothetical protein BD324DRAFT_457446 [Kockovaella imperatae]ORX36617.1 hypothetical protein BD324DRAFT_457446 [Kockovaella imperatae]